MKKPIRFGVFGLGRGGALIDCIAAAGAEVVAICDYRPTAIAHAKEKIAGCANAVAYSDFDSFLQHDMDAVLLCNYFCDHAPYAIQAMRAGKHVLSETLSNITMAQGVELCRVKEETGMIYAILENCPFFKENLEMGRVYQEGSLGELVYAEGEYLHPLSPEEQNGLAPGMRHWRNWTPRTYYSTHALAPLMQMTDSMPTRVTAMAAFQPEVAEGTALQTGDAAAVILCQTDKNAVLRVIGWGVVPPHGCYYRLRCTKGSMETNYTTEKMQVFYNRWTAPEGKSTFTEYDFEWPDPELGKIADGSGHGGGDFMMIHQLVQDLEAGREPYFDVYRSTAMSSVAILAWRSVLTGISYDIPDFRREEDRKRYENDRISPYPDEKGEVHIPCSSQPYAPGEDDLQTARECWKKADMLLN